MGKLSFDVIMVSLALIFVSQAFPESFSIPDNPHFLSLEDTDAWVTSAAFQLFESVNNSLFPFTSSELGKLLIPELKQYREFVSPHP